MAENDQQPVKKTQETSQDIQSFKVYSQHHNHVSMVSVNNAAVANNTNSCQNNLAVNFNFNKKIFSFSHYSFVSFFFKFCF